MDDRRPLKGARPATRKWITAVAVAVLLGAGVWFSGEPAAPGAPSEPDDRAAITSPASPSSLLQRAPLPDPLAQRGRATVSTTAEERDIVAGPKNENLVPGAKPHPITPEHLALYREVDLVESTWTALEHRDFEQARALIERHRSSYGGKNDDLDEGMWLLADCMQHPSDETRGRAQRFYDEETYSTARRRIRRWCLEP